MQPKYKASIEDAIRLHIVPVIGDMYIRDVQYSDAQKIITALAGKSNSLQSKVVSTAKKIFKSAVKDHLIYENPCEELKINGKKTPKKRALTDEQVAVLLDAVKETRAESFVMLGIYAGLRREETLGLRWEDVHLDAKDPYLDIRHTVTYPTNSRAIVNDILKSDAAARVIPIVDVLLDYLKKHEAKEGYVIGGEKPLSYQQYNNLWRIIERRQTGPGWYWDKKDGKQKKVTFYREKGQESRSGDFCYTIDFPVTSHILRHTRASTWIRDGVDPKTVQYLLGHEDPKFTLEIYTHIIDESPAALSKAIKKGKKVADESIG